MTRSCDCQASHPHKHIVLTGGPGAGKTAVLELAHQFFCAHVVFVPESASLLFRGGFPRGGNTAQQQATQRAIYYVQRELEATTIAADNAAVMVCDRGTVDGSAYWLGEGDIFSAVGTSREAEFARYAMVVHLRVPHAADYQNHTNVHRTETAEEAAAIDDRILHAWDGHPHRIIIESTASFLDKAHQAIDILAAEVPACCHRPQSS